MTALGWGLAAFVVWVTVVLFACALLGVAQRKRTPRVPASSDFSRWERSLSGEETEAP